MCIWSILLYGVYILVEVSFDIYFTIEYRRLIRNNMKLKIKVKGIFYKWDVNDIEWTASD